MLAHVIRHREKKLYLSRHGKWSSLIHAHLFEKHDNAEHYLKISHKEGKIVKVEINEV